MVIERGALVCVGLSAGRRTVGEAHRVLKPGGLFFANPYSDKDSSASSGVEIGDGLRDQITEGMLTGVGALCFYGRRDVEGLFAAGWKTRSIQHAELVDITGPEVFRACGVENCCRAAVRAGGQPAACRCHGYGACFSLAQRSLHRRAQFFAKGSGMGCALCVVRQEPRKQRSSHPDCGDRGN